MEMSNAHIAAAQRKQDLKQEKMKTIQEFMEFTNDLIWIDDQYGVGYKFTRLLEESVSALQWNIQLDKTFQWLHCNTYRTDGQSIDKVVGEMMAPYGIKEANGRVVVFLDCARTVTKTDDNTLVFAAGGDKRTMQGFGSTIPGF